MTSNTGPRAGGALLALCVLIGALIGTLRGEPTIGILIGAGAGVLAAVLVWLADRPRV